MVRIARFSLIRWFSLLSLFCISAISITTSMLLSRFLTERMLERDAVVTMQFVQSISQVEEAAAYFLGRRPVREGHQLEEFFTHIAGMPDVLRANAYASDGTIVWSSNPQLVGRRFAVNDELQGALNGELQIKSGVAGREVKPKPEHMLLGTSLRFVENYIPVREPVSREVIGVVEVYREPSALFDAIRAGTLLIWASAVAGGLLLFASLFWMIRRADWIIRKQQERLLEAETLALVGEMAGAVAHGIRNPLASIRSSAELMLEDNSPAAKDSGRDIVDAVDRLEQWVRDLLTYAQPESEPMEEVRLEHLIPESLEVFHKEMERRGVKLTLILPEKLPAVLGDAALLKQAFISLLANALEAMPNGGALSLETKVLADAEKVQVVMHDSGVGIPSEQMDKVFLPFHTTKQKGLGVGLPLVKRVVGRCGGSVTIESEPGCGTSVVLQIPVAG
jgi:two-component system sensor histidine kinase HydH